MTEQSMGLLRDNSQCLRQGGQGQALTWAKNARLIAEKLPEKHLRAEPAIMDEKCHLAEVQKGSNPLQVPRQGDTTPQQRAQLRLAPLKRA